MPRKATSKESAATRAKTRSRANKTSASESSSIAPNSPELPARTRKDSGSIAQSLIDGAQQLQETHSQLGSQNVPDLNSHAPTDYAAVSGDSPEIPKSEAEAMIEQIGNKINGQKVIQKNLELASNVELSRQGLAKALQSQVKAGAAMEGVSAEVAKHEAQVESTRLERERALQKALEADGLQALRDLITQEAQQKHALKSAQIARLEQKTARLLNDDIGSVDSPEALPIEY